MSSDKHDLYRHYRAAYRKLWLDDLGGIAIPHTSKSKGLSVLNSDLSGLDKLVAAAEKGNQHIAELARLIRDVTSPPQRLGAVHNELVEIDRELEELGFHYGHLGPMARMFVFAKENLSGTEALELASQMGGIYSDLIRRCEKLSNYYNGLA